MSEIPEIVLRYTCERMIKKRHPLYFLLDKEGRILKWGGPFSIYRLSEPVGNEQITDRYFFMEGLLPLEEKSVELSFIQISPEITVDLHIFLHNGSVWVLLLDASQHEADIAPLLQRANELNLLYEAAGTDGPTMELRQNGKGIPSADHGVLSNLLKAMDLAVLQLNPDSSFKLIGAAPSWLNLIWPRSVDSAFKYRADEAAPFLANFILDAHQFWENNTTGRLESGVWSESFKDNKDYLMEASALFAVNHKVLTIECERGLVREKQTLIQKGRNLALKYDTLDRLEKELTKAKADLESRVRQRTSELEAANRKLASELKERERISHHLQQAQKMEAIGTLAGGIAHDFNNILSAVIGYTEIVLADMPRDDMAHFNLEQVLKAGFRAKDLVKQILTFSRQADQEIKPVQVRQVTQEALTLLRASLPSTIEFRHDLKSNANVLADPIQIHQIVMNLGTNAAHAMEETGGVLDVRLTNICLPLLWAKNLGVKPGDHIELKVIDTGQGISPETCERIFDPFFTTKEKGRGTGMGLSVVHGILKNCGGAVTVESTVGKGSTFTVFFPVLHMSRPPTHQKERVLRRGQERILFVDDEPFQSDMTGQILRRLGYDVIAFTDSVASLRKFSLTPDAFDLVITDMTMPRMTGAELARKILEIKPDMPIILCSGLSESITRDKAEFIGIREILMKPIVMHDMAETVRRVLDGN